MWLDEMGKSGMQKASNQVRDFALATLALWHRAQTRGGLSPCSAVIFVEHPRLHREDALSAELFRA